MSFFKKRINKAIRDDEDDKGDVKNDSNRWVIGSTNEMLVLCILLYGKEQRVS